MRRLTLIRHAQASRDDGALTDFDRPLTQRGRGDAEAVAMLVAAHRPAVARLISSPALRALQTAEIFAAALGLASSAIKQEPRIYDAMPGSLLDIVNHFDDADAHLWLFGHNPGLSGLAQVLAQVPFAEMATCGVADLSFNVSSWQQVAPGGGTLLSYRSP